MKHKNKKCLSIMLTLCMVVGLFPAMTTTAAAAGNDPRIVTITNGGALPPR